MSEIKIGLAEKDIPKKWYNIAADGPSAEPPGAAAPGGGR